MDYHLGKLIKDHFFSLWTHCITCTKKRTYFIIFKSYRFMEKHCEQCVACLQLHIQHFSKAWLFMKNIQGTLEKAKHGGRKDWSYWHSTFSLDKEKKNPAITQVVDKETYSDNFSSPNSTQYTWCYIWV